MWIMTNLTTINEDQDEDLPITLLLDFCQPAEFNLMQLANWNSSQGNHPLK